MAEPQPHHPIDPAAITAPDVSCPLTESIPGDDSPEHTALISQVYGQLRSLAAAYLRRQPLSHTLQPTALVHEVFVKLTKEPGSIPRFSSEDPTRFFALAATAMRQILVDHARAKLTDKRGGGRQRFSIDSADAPVAGPSLDVLDLHEALGRFAVIDPRAAKVVELRFFAGLSIGEAASVLGVSDWTIEQDWRSARAWLGWELRP